MRDKMSQIEEHRPYRKMHTEQRELVKQFLAEKDITKIKTMSMQFLKDLLNKFADRVKKEDNKDKSLFIEDTLEYKEGFKNGYNKAKETIPEIPLGT